MVSAIINTDQNLTQNKISEEKDKRKLHRVPIIVGSSIAGGIFVYAGNNLAHKAMLKDAKNLRKYITPEVVDKTMELPEIKKLDVHLADARWMEKNSDLAKKIRGAKNELQNSQGNSIFKKLRISRLNTYRKRLHAYPMGKQASFNATMLVDYIALNKQRGGALVFHELGHAKNYRSNNIIKNLMIKSKNPIISGALIIAGLCCATIPRAKEEEKDTFGGKTKNVLKNNCIGITAVGGLMIPLEEGIASIRGAKIAKKILPKEQLRLVNKMNLKAFCSYGSMAAGAILATYLASKIFDKVVESKDEKVIANEKNKALDTNA